MWDKERRSAFRRVFGRCFQKKGGGSKTTQSRTIPNQTPEERSLQDALMKYAEKGLKMTDEDGGILDQARTAIGKMYMPDWSQASANTNAALSDALHQYGGRTDGNAQGSSSELAGALSQYVNAANHNYQNFLGRSDTALGSYNDEMNGVKGQYRDLTNGVLPSAYSEARQKALNVDLSKTIGSLVNSYGNRGVLNSSVTNKALADVSDSAADTLARQYTSDLSTEANLLNGRTSMLGDIFGKNYGVASDQYHYGKDTADSIYQNSASNAASRYGMGKDAADSLYQGAVNNAQAQFQNRMSAQQASTVPASTLLEYASQLYGPASNLFNTMYSGRMGTGSTTTSTKQSTDPWSLVGTLGSAAIMCFAAGTLVTLPHGYTEIQDVRAGDAVLSLDEKGQLTPRRVLRVVRSEEPRSIVSVYFENGTVWHTTKGQRFFDGAHFIYAEEGREEAAVVFGGTPTKILRVVPTGLKAVVYDLVLEGGAAQNVFFANDVAAEGLGD